MTEKDIIKEALSSCGWTQEILAEKLGYKGQSCIAGRLTGNSMRVDTFVKFLDAMGYKVMVVSKSPTANKNKWTINYNEDEEIGEEVSQQPEVKKDSLSQVEINKAIMEQLASLQEQISKLKEGE